MTAIKHSAVVAAYGILAVVVAVLIAERLPISSGALSIGLAVFVLFAVVHQLVARSAADSEKDRVDELDARYRDLARALHRISRRHDALRDGSLGEIVYEAFYDDRLLQKITTEFRVMQSLKGQISAVPEKPAAAAAFPLTGDRGEETRILDIISEALKHERVDLFLQPIMQLPERRPVFYECYSRIRAPDGSVVMPAQYMEVARKCGLLQAIDNMLLFRCVQLVRKTQRTSHAIGFVCNISAQTVGDRRFFPDFLAFLSDNRGLASRLIFEMPEEDVTTRWDSLCTNLEKLAGLGFRFSMDRVKTLAFDPPVLAARHIKYVKVDAETLIEQRAHLPTLRIDLQQHRIGLIAEKVETEQQLARLLDLNVTHAQGFLLGAPKLSRKD